MKYGEIQYNDIRDLHLPNMILGRSKDGDWVDRFDEQQTAIDEGEVVLEGFNAIDKYAESALERFERYRDVRAGLVAIRILHHYNERFGNTTARMHDEIIAALLDQKWPDSYLFILADDSNPALAESLRDTMRARAKAASTLGDLTADRHLMRYLEATATTENLDESLQQLIGFRKE